MQAAQHQKLIRKQYLMSPEQIEKLQRLAGERGASAAEIVRLAIDAYEPDDTGKLDAPELMTLVSARLKEAIAATRRANRTVARTLKALEKPEDR
ncbi:MAG: hypothetical protein U9Q71_01500 [Pseudomonadota bacterium]|nr:hypothetical protein [Pseudomonadota bacterium]